MSDDDALGPDMHPLLGFLESTPPVASQDILDQLLERRLDAGSASAGNGELARLLADHGYPRAVWTGVGLWVDLVRVPPLTWPVSVSVTRPVEKTTPRLYF